MNLLRTLISVIRKGVLNANRFVKRQGNRKIVEALVEEVHRVGKVEARKSEKRFLKVKEAYQYLNIGDETFRKLREAGEIRPITIPGTSLERFDRKELDKFMEQNQL